MKNITLAFLLILSATLGKSQSPADLVLDMMTAWGLDPAQLAKVGVRAVTIRKYQGEHPDTGFVYRRFLLNESGQPTDYFAILANGSTFKHIHNEWNRNLLVSVVESQPPQKYRKTDLYYSKGLLASTCDTQDRCWEFHYDKRDSLIGVMEGKESWYKRWKLRRTYDEQGRRICDSLSQSSRCQVVHKYAYDDQNRIIFHTMLLYRDIVEEWTEQRYSYGDYDLVREENIQVKDGIPYNRIYQYDDQRRVLVEETYGIGKKRPQKWIKWHYSEDGRRVESEYFSKRKKKPGQRIVKTFREDGLPAKSNTSIGKKFWIINTFEYGFAP